MGDEEDFTQLPLPDQFAHKNWKARKGGYETATKDFKVAQPNDSLVREFTDGQIWKAAVSDSNVAAQQEALAAYNAFLDASGTDGARKTRGSTVAGVVEKGLTGRPAAKQAAQETLLLLIELDKADPVIEELLPFLAHKQPKIIAATLAALTGLFHAYGCKTIEPKPVIKLLPKVFGHADKNVRAEAQNLTVELYRWLREAMKPLFWGELKEVQQKDLEKLFEPVKAEPVPKQERLLRSQQEAREEAAAQPDDAGGADGDVDGDEAGEIDLEPEYIAVDVFAKIPNDFSERLASAKWKDRKEALDDLFTAVNVPAMQDGPFDEVLRGLAKSMKDANIAVVAVAANCVECIAKGLRKGFTKYRSTILAPILERFKEKKQTVTDALAAACDAVFMSVGLADIEADVLEALKSKNPQVKEHSAHFLVRSLKTTKEAPSMEQTKEFAEAGKKLLTESVATLRDAGAEILGVLWKIMGDRNMLSHLDGLDDIRKNKIKEFCDAAEVKAKWKPKAAAPPPKANVAPAGKKPALGAKKVAPVGTKKPAAAPRIASPAPAEEAPLQPRPTSRPAVKAPAGLKAPGTGLKPPSGLQKPGTGLKAPSAISSSTASPQRHGVVFDEAPQLAAPKSGIAAPGRGLAGRPLGKPALPTSPSRNPEPASARSPPPQSALSSIERQELSELRTTVELLQQQNADLRNDKLRTASAITELQNQNAQLIEDHTRDVLQIKAKETQLVRARSDAESAEERANSLAKEIERLKREMGRLGRGRAPSDAPVDSPGVNGSDAPRPSAYGSRTYNVPSARAYGVDAYAGSGGALPSAAAATVPGDGEGKENIPDSTTASHLRFGLENNKLNSAAGTPSAVAPPSRPLSYGSRGAQSPDEGLPSTLAHAPSQQQHSYRSSTSVSSSSGGAGDGVESWRRAAEVTQNLKARIEMMKARQNVSRGQ
ncbi:armadillo-type protein [Neohortaea acidophila]|uniref:Armadillo-type protein n=1 Tax=Neohortaea acidophila TaxID=245834 RepID=A0A6A6PGU9_9PEZI|nr:armadillo-type protein [Neohortaea acidophila]KAF2479212.1 armadillo-type protein [Neohortaea acidophila]